MNRWFVGAALVLLSSTARAGEEWKREKPWKDLLAAEVKALTPLLRSALKEDYRRQAWYLADRLLAADPEHEEARQTLERWNDTQLQEGMIPKQAWLEKRDKALREVGNGYARLAETLTQAGLPAEDFYPLNVRSRAYGTNYAPAIQAFDEAGFVWLGTFGDLEHKTALEALGDLIPHVSYPPEFDDDYLEVRVRWPAARVAAWDLWHLTTDLKTAEALGRLALIAALERYLVTALGSELKKTEEPTDVLLFSDAKEYDRLADAILEERERTEARGASAYYSSWRRTALVLWRHRTTPWIGADAVLLGTAGPIVARRHVGGDTRSWITGRGSVLLEGLAGACQGFMRSASGGGEIEPKSCWLLVAARLLREEGSLLPWAELLELDDAKADALPPRNLRIPFNGGVHENVPVNVAHAQATALCVGILRAEGGKGGRRLGRLLHDLFLRDSLPDLDKTLGWKRGRAFEEADVAMDATL